jgi:hypothetical protein
MNTKPEAVLINTVLTAVTASKGIGGLIRGIAVAAVSVQAAVVLLSALLTGPVIATMQC